MPMRASSVRPTPPLGPWRSSVALRNPPGPADLEPKRLGIGFKRQLVGGQLPKSVDNGDPVARPYPGGQVFVRRNLASQFVEHCLDSQPVLRDGTQCSETGEHASRRPYKRDNRASKAITVSGVKER
jgi:hypothetical protein